MRKYPAIDEEDLSLTVDKADPFDIVRFWNQQRTEKGWWHSFELPDGSRIDGVCDLTGLKHRLAQFPIPDDLSGKRVLDIGTWDGWFAFEMEKRGAEVVAVDMWDNPRFHEMHARLGSRVEYVQSDIYELTPERIGRFDVVLFFGVLYHLKHPLLALERVCALTTDLAAIDSFILREQHVGNEMAARAVMEFYETNEFGGQTDNWVGPTLACLTAMCRTAGFAQVVLQGVIDYSACLACYRQWPTPPGDVPAGPEVTHASHHLNGGINFRSRLDEYVSAWFRSDRPELTIDDVKPQVSEYGVRPISLHPSEGGWQTNFKLPPGLTPGWHEVTVRVGDSRAGSGKRIAVDLNLPVQPIFLHGVHDSVTWAKGKLETQKGNWLSIWVSGLPENADANNVRVYLDGRRLKVVYVGAPAEGSTTQINVEVPAEVPRGTAYLGVALADQQTDPEEVEIL